MRCHYLTDGTVNFAFTVRRQEFFVPVGILFKCFMEVSDKEMSEKLMACCAEVQHPFSSETACGDSSACDCPCFASLLDASLAKAAGQRLWDKCYRRVPIGKDKVPCCDYTPCIPKLANG